MANLDSKEAVVGLDTGGCSQLVASAVCPSCQRTFLTYTQLLVRRVHAHGELRLARGYARGCQWPYMHHRLWVAQ